MTTTATLLTAALGTALCALAGTGASAQSAAPEKPITIKLGAFFPTGSRLHDGVSDTWFSAGAEYALAQKPAMAASPISLLGYVDYAGINKHSRNVSYVGIGPGIHYGLAAPGSSTLIPYVGAGIGAYFLHGSGLGTGSSNKTNLGYRLNAGVELNHAYVFEVNYTDANSLSGIRFSGFNIQLGAKF